MDELLRTLERALVSQGGMSQAGFQRLAGQLQALNTYEEALQEYRRTHGTTRGIGSRARAFARQQANLTRSQVSALRQIRASAVANQIRPHTARLAANMTRAGRLPFWLTRLFLGNPAVIAGVVAVALIVGVGLYLYYRTQGGEDQVAGSLTKEQRLAAAIYCDCGNIEAGILNVGWIPVCRDHEAGLIARALDGELDLQVSDQGVITGGDVCGNPDNGPGAWPVVGASAEMPPIVIREERCTRFVGLAQLCADE